MKLLFFLSFLFVSAHVAAQTSRGNIYAVVVGISQYADPLNNLPCPRRDGIDMYNLLKQHTTSDKILLLTDGQATRDNILKYAEQLFRRTTPADIVIFFFSGHGCQGGFATHDGYLDYDDLKRIFGKTGATRKIIFANACFSGGLRLGNSSSNHNFKDIGNQRVCLFLSSRTNQYSWESTGLKNSFFPYFLIAGLRGGADRNKDKIITARELFDFVNPKVRQYSGGDQIPVMWGKFEDTMELLNWTK